MPCVQYNNTWLERSTGTLVVLSDGVIRILQRHRQSGLTTREAGGVLLGLRRGQHIEVVEASAPSVFDERGRFSFVRKSAKHQKLARARWEQSNGTIDHVGEWHTHPQRHPSPSFLDVKEWQALQARRRDNSPMLGIIVGTKSLLVSIIYRSSLVRLDAIND
jgi:integrative and conjugative element protein (TIGR02256 family)